MHLHRCVQKEEYDKKNSFAKKFQDIVEDIQRRCAPGPNDPPTIVAQQGDFLKMLNAWGCDK
jgi:hypothetical protein